MRAASVLLVPLVFAAWASGCARGVSATSTTPAHAAELTPAEILQRALAARQPAGVSERPGFCIKLHGTASGRRGPYATAMEMCQQGSRLVRLDILAPDELKSLYVDDGERAWERTRAGIAEVPHDEVVDQRHYQYVDWISMLWPLRGGGYRLVSLGHVEVRGKPTVGLRVSRDGELDLDLFVDTTTWLVVKHSLRHEDVVQHEMVVDETFYSGWRVTDGVRYPSHSETLRNGEPKSSYEIEMTFPEELGADMFRKPSP